jgi:hypothetical protein
MNDSESQAGKPTLNQPHHSDGSELRPAEVQANQRQAEHNEDETRSSLCCLRFHPG